MRFNIVIYSFVGFISLALSGMDFNFSQNRYDLLVERVEEGDHGKDLVDFYELKGFKTRKDGILFNATLNLVQDIHAFKIMVEAMQFLSQQYRKTNIKMTGDGCKVMQNSALIQPLKTTNGNFTNCPLVKGLYHIFNFRPDPHSLPPLVPEGQYKLIMTFYTMDNRLLFGLDFYAKLFYGVKKQ